MHYGRFVLAGVALAIAGASPALANTSDFLTMAIKGDNSEMKLGALAARMGSTPAVRNFGAMLDRDHTKGRMQAARVARAHDVPVSSAMTAGAQAEYAKLRRMRGTAFDHEFARFMAQDHQKVIAAFQQETTSRDPADVRALARQTLPTLHKHLDAARDLL